MKYGRWKREAKRQRHEYRLKASRPINVKAFFLPDESPAEDATRAIQQAIDNAGMGVGGGVWVADGQYRITKPIGLSSNSRGSILTGIIYDPPEPPKDPQ